MRAVRAWVNRLFSKIPEKSVATWPGLEGRAEEFAGINRSRSLKRRVNHGWKVAQNFWSHQKVLTWKNVAQNVSAISVTLKKLSKENNHLIGENSPNLVTGWNRDCSGSRRHSIIEFLCTSLAVSHFNLTVHVCFVFCPMSHRGVGRGCSSLNLIKTLRIHEFMT
jgi:hypothetical protein